MGRWCWRFRGRGRPPKERWIRATFENIVFVPVDDSGMPIPNPPLYLRPDEFEALRLVYLEGRKQEEAAQLMRISRGTLWRALDSGRRKLIQALVERRPIIIGLGPFPPSPHLKVE